MNKQLIMTIAAGVAFLLLVFLVSKIARRFRPRKLNVAYYTKRWVDAQGLCGKENTWPLAIINADKLLDDALKSSHFKGKTMGERLVSAQHQISSNDAVWFGHKLRNKLVHEDLTKLSKKEVMDAMLGFRNALKDLGALK